MCIDYQRRSGMDSKTALQLIYDRAKGELEDFPDNPMTLRKALESIRETAKQGIDGKGEQ
jgi:hypothetical protein